MELIKLNLRGTVFVTTTRTVNSAPDSSPLKSLQKSAVSYDPVTSEYFFDRNPEIFHQILDFYSTGKLHVPRHVCTESVRDELNFWKVPPGHVEKCCWKPFYQIDNDLDIIHRLSEFLPCPNMLSVQETQPQLDNRSKEVSNQSLKSRIWKFLNNESNSIGAKIWSASLSFTIVLSIILYILVTLPFCRVEREVYIPFPDSHLPTSPKVEMYWHTATHPVILCIDAACNALLSIEWLVRLFTCPNKRLFLKSFLNITDIVACVFIWIFVVLDHHRDILATDHSYEAMLFLGAMYSTRVFRVFRIVRHNCGTKILLLALKSSAPELGILALSFGCFAVVFAALIYMAEINNSYFPDILTSVWWSVITMTTVGYGDMVPSSSPGYLVGTISAVFGILLIALPIAVTSSNFFDFYSFNKYRTRFVKDRNSAIGKPAM